MNAPPDSPSEIASALAAAAMAHGQAALAAGDPAEALRWFDRTRRLAPTEAIADFLRATALLRLRDPAALPLLRQLAAAHDVREVWTALAAAARQAGDAPLAAEAMAAALSRHATTSAFGPAVAAVARMVGYPGWCGISGDGLLHVGADNARGLRIVLDGRALPVRLRDGVQRLPAGWESARRLTVEYADAPLLGSPVDPAAIQHLEGCVQTCDGGLEGWAWHPHDPDADPVLTLRDAKGRQRRIRCGEAAALRHPRLLARPRRVDLPASALDGLVPPLRVLGPDGRDLPGNPVDPGLEQRTALAIAQGIAARHASGRARAGVPVPAEAPLRVARGLPRKAGRASGRAQRILVIAAPGMRRQQLEAIRASLPRGIEMIAAKAAASGDAEAINTVLRAGAGQDFVLLQSGFQPAESWLNRLRDAACRNANTGTASPLSTGSGLLGLPRRCAAPASIHGLDEVARAANGADAVAIPTADGPCVYISGECLAETGLLRQSVFPRLPAALADFCLRAGHFGWIHVAAAGLVIGLEPDAADDPVRACLAARDAAMLDRLHPGRQALAVDDPLVLSRFRIDLARWKSGRSRAGSVVMVTHAEGGGVERLVQSRCAAAREDGKRPVVLRPAPGGCAVEDGAEEYPDLCFELPTELPALVRLLKAERPSHVELHHMLGHAPSVAELPHLLGVPGDAFVHDYAAFCPRIALVGPERRYCGEPDIAQCAICIADAGSNLEKDIGVPELRARSLAQLRAARQVVAPSADAAQRMRRHFPGIRPHIVPWEDDAALPPSSVAPARPVRRVAVIGAIGVEKGYEVLLACARDAAARDLKLEFVVVGHTIDDARLMDTGRVFVTGAYADDEVVELIRAQDADISFIPSIWPETWCYTLTHSWRAGLDAAAFDIGAQAERIRRTGRGWLLPLGLQAAAVNNAFVTGAHLACNRPSSHHPAQHYRRPRVVRSRNELERK